MCMMTDHGVRGSAYCGMLERAGQMKPTLQEGYWLVMPEGTKRAKYLFVSPVSTYSNKRRSEAEYRQRTRYVAKEYGAEYIIRVKAK